MFSCDDGVTVSRVNLVSALKLRVLPRDQDSMLFSKLLHCRFVFQFVHTDLPHWLGWQLCSGTLPHTFPIVSWSPLEKRPHGEIELPFSSFADTATHKNRSDKRIQQQTTRPCMEKIDFMGGLPGCAAFIEDRNYHATS